MQLEAVLGGLSWGAGGHLLLLLLVLVGAADGQWEPVGDGQHLLLLVVLVRAAAGVALRGDSGSLTSGSPVCATASSWVKAARMRRQQQQGMKGERRRIRSSSSCMGSTMKRG